MKISACAIPPPSAKILGFDFNFFFFFVFQVCCPRQSSWKTSQLGYREVLFVRSLCCLFGLLFLGCFGLKSKNRILINNGRNVFTYVLKKIWQFEKQKSTCPHPAIKLISSNSYWQSFNSIRNIILNIDHWQPLMWLIFRKS